MIVSSVIEIQDLFSAYRSGVNRKDIDLSSFGLFTFFTSPYFTPRIIASFVLEYNSVFPTVLWLSSSSDVKWTFEGAVLCISEDSKTMRGAGVSGSLDVVRRGG